MFLATLRCREYAVSTVQTLSFKRFCMQLQKIGFDPLTNIDRQHFLVYQPVSWHRKRWRSIIPSTFDKKDGRISFRRESRESSRHIATSLEGWTLLKRSLFVAFLKPLYKPPSHAEQKHGVPWHGGAGCWWPVHSGSTSTRDWAATFFCEEWVVIACWGVRNTSHCPSLYTGFYFLQDAIVKRSANRNVTSI